MIHENFFCSSLVFFVLNVSSWNTYLQQGTLPRNHAKSLIKTTQSNWVVFTLMFLVFKRSCLWKSIILFSYHWNNAFVWICTFMWHLLALPWFYCCISKLLILVCWFYWSSMCAQLIKLYNCRNVFFQRGFYHFWYIKNTLCQFINLSKVAPLNN